MKKITGEQVKSAMISADIIKVDHHDCCMCGVMTYYFREGEQLYFNGGCGCGFGEFNPQPRPWSDAAGWINMQIDEECRKNIMTKFGLTGDEK